MPNSKILEVGVARDMDGVGSYTSKYVDGFGDGRGGGNTTSYFLGSSQRGVPHGAWTRSLFADYDRSVLPSHAWVSAYFGDHDVGDGKNTSGTDDLPTPPTTE